MVVIVSSLTYTHKATTTAQRKRLTFIETSGFAAPPLASFLPGTAGIIYMVDSKNCDLFPEARRILDDLLKSEEVAGVPVIIFVNKIDHYGAVGPEEFMMLMGWNNGNTGLDVLRKERAIEVMFGSVVLGQGMWALSSLLCFGFKVLLVASCADLD
jgi:hypothetical protein